MVYLLHHLLSESAAAFPDREAILFKDAMMTYAQLERDSSKLAVCLSETGVRRGDRVGIHMNRSIDSIVGAFGILKAGAAYVPIDPMSPANRLGYIINACGIRTLLTSREKLSNIERISSESPTLGNIMVMNGVGDSSRALGSLKLCDWKEMRESADYVNLIKDAVDTDLAYVLFTSGSTGNPKGVMISHLNSLTFVNSACDFFGIEPGDRFSNICPLHFDMSVFDLFVAFKAGASVAIIPESTATFPVKLAEFIERNRVSVWNSVPSALSLLANLTTLDRYDFSSLRLVLFAGEVFPIKHLRRLRGAVPAATFYNIYGQTEANSSTYYRVEEIPADDAAVLPIGKPFPNFEVFALDEGGKQIRNEGEKGELFVRASSVARGYWGDPERTAECFVRNPVEPHLDEKVYKTRDLVSLDSDGNYLFLGRKDHMIKSRGYRIEIGEIETALSAHPGVKTAVVVPIPDDLIGNRITAVVVASGKQAVRKEELMKFCGERLPKYMIPEVIEFQDVLPMTSSGKTDRKKLVQMMSGMVVPTSDQ